MSPLDKLDRESCYRAVKSRDRRFDGVFYTAVRTTGIYCRPSCPARTPALKNVTFHPSAAAAQAAGYRACKRCLPDATPGSPDWDTAADAAGRAMRLIADGVVDREGVPGLAARVGYTPRHLTRILTAELGAGPLALARAKRAQTARVLIETTQLTHADIAFAAGFSSVRQFNDTIREVYAATPTELRGRRHGPPATGTLTMRLAVRTPFAGSALLGFLALRAVPGVEATGPGWYARTLALPHGAGTVRLDVPDAPTAGETAFVTATFALDDLRDTAAAVERTRRMLDADCDPVAVADAFAGDPVVGPLVRRNPGLRVPGHVDGNEIAVRAVLGQQVSVAGARTVAARLVQAHGRAPERRGRPGGRRADPPVPGRGDDRRARPGRPAHAAGPGEGAGRAVRRAGRRHDRAGPGPGPRPGPPRAAGHPRHRALDRRLRRARARSATPTCSCRPTSASATRSPRWVATRGTPPVSPRAGDRGAPTPRCTCGRHWSPHKGPPEKETTDMWTLMDSPVGELRIVERDGMITAIEFSPFRASTDGRPIGERDDDNPVLARAVGQLTAYFARDLKEFDLPLAPQGSDFQRRVWDALLGIGYGETASYGEIAHRLGMTNAASRAVGLANGRNPIPIVIPCHRVIGANGTLTGYAGGLERKQTLLGIEQDALF